MKKNIQSLVIIGIMMLLNLTVNAQVTTGFNFGVTTDWVGWNALQAFDLNINHKGPFNINFLTNDVQRMQIAADNPFVGIGINAQAGWMITLKSPAVNTPTYMCFQHPSFANTHVQFGIAIGGGATQAGTMQLASFIDAPIDFHSWDDYLNGGGKLKIRFTTNGEMNGRDGIRIFNPGYPGSTGYNALSNIDIWPSDNNGTNINFGDNGSIVGTGTVGTQRLLLTGKRDGIVFNAAASAVSTANTIFQLDGIEVARISNSPTMAV